MKELKKLSLKEEVDREARKIQREIEDRDDLDDISVSEDMETSLFEKIQEYEYDKRLKKEVRRRKTTLLLSNRPFRRSSGIGIPPLWQNLG